MVFSAYEHLDTFEAAAEVARTRLRDSVSTELVMCARGSQYRGDQVCVESYVELYPLILKFQGGGCSLPYPCVLQ